MSFLGTPALPLTLAFQPRDPVWPAVQSPITQMAWQEKSGSLTPVLTQEASRGQGGTCVGTGEPQHSGGDSGLWT